jgi:catechol 2,3-dioxygenase-like lactoylglutathione lyase family enzyme
MLGQAAAAAVLPVTDLNKAVDFYSQTLGLKQKGFMEGGVMLEAGMGTMVFIYERPQVAVEHTQLGFSVANIEAEVAELRGKGVEFEDYDMPGLSTEDGIATIGTSKSAWFKDPDGNIIAINQM